MNVEMKLVDTFQCRNVPAEVSILSQYLLQGYLQSPTIGAPANTSGGIRFIG
jgi:hypothetical protein